MESFYGGRQGISFIIVKRFDGIDIEPNTSFTIKYFAFDVSKNSFILDENNTPILKTHITSKIYKDWKLHENDGSEIVYEEQIGNFPIEYAEGMIQCFAQGGMTTDVVNYGEYVIIDTPDKNNVDNGKIYRRGLDYQNDLAGAEYIGQIVGPQGDSPEIMMDSFTTLVKEGGPQISYEKEDIIPGMELGEDNQPIYNDAIKSSWVTIKDKFGVITGCKIGFQFPYHVFNFTAKSVGAYTEGELIQRIDDKKHPYFSEWKISVPKGVKGDTLSNLQVVNGMAKKGAKYYNDIDCTEEAGILEQDVAIEINNENYSDDASKGKPIILPNPKTRNVNIKYVKTEDTYKEIAVYKITNYDKKDEQHSFVTLGDYNMIHNISLSENGTLTIEYTHDDTKIYEKIVKWIKEVKFDRDKGQITLIFNTGDVQILNEQENEKIKWIDDIYVEPDGKIKVKYNTNKDNPDVIINENNLIQWLTNIQLTDDGEIKVIYNTDPTEVDDLEGNKVPFEGHVINNNDKIRWIKHDSNNDEFGIKINTSHYSTELDEFGNEIGDLGEGTGSQKIQVTYNTGETHEIGEPLNYIIECVVTYDPSLLPNRYKDEESGKIKNGVAEAGHLLVIYSDPAYRTYLKENNKCKIWPSTKMNQNDEGYFDEWYDMGIAKGDPGTVKVVTTYTTEQLKPIFENKQTPEELFGDEYKGWLIGKQDTETDPVILYYYNYQIITIDGIESAIGWKELGAVTAASSLMQPENVVGINTSTDKAVDLKTNGLLFVKKNDTENIITNIIEKINNDIVNPENNFSKPYYFSSFAKYINPTLNAGVNTLEEQLLIGFNTITEEWVDENKNTHIKTKFLINENEQEYYILHSTIFENNNNNLKGSNFVITDSTLTFDNDKDQSFELKTNEDGEEYYSLSFNNTKMYAVNENGEINVTTDILAKEDILSIYKDGIITDIYKKQVTVQLASNGHKFTKEKIVNLMS